MEDNKEMVKDAQDGVGDDIMMVETRAEKEELSCPEEETHLGNKDSPQFNGTQTGKEGSFQFEDAEVENKECLILDHNVATDKLYTEKDPIHPDSSLKEQALIEPSVVISVRPVVDPDIGSNTNEPQGNDDKTDGKHLVPLIQSDSVVLSEMSLDTQVEDEMEQELKNGLSGMELDQDNTTTKDDLNNGEMGTHLPPEHGTEDKALNNEMCGLELPLGNETKDEELNVGATEMELELPLDIETKEEMQNVVTGSDLPPDNEIKEELNIAVSGTEVLADNEIKEELPKLELDVGDAVDVKSSNKSFLLEPNASVGGESGTEVEQAAFMKELEIFHKERCLEFKPPRFYGEPLNCLKLWRAVVRLGGYEQVTACKLWRQVGESFKPPKTCTTVSWTFRCFYEKALLEYEKHKMRSGELPFTDASFTEPMSAGNQPGLHQASGSGRARRDAAARAMQGWHSQRLLGNGEVGDPIIKDKNSVPTPKREKHLKSIGLLKRKKVSPVERAVKAARLKASKPQPVTMVVDIGPPADWVKVNVQRTKDCFEVYALVPGLLREEVRVQSDPAGRLVISGQPEQLDNPWGVTPFKKVVSLPSRIDPHQTSAVVTLHGQLFVRVPFEQSDL